MQTLKEKYETILAFVKKHKKSTPYFSSAWFNIDKVPLDELREFVKYLNSIKKPYDDDLELKFNDSQSVMTLQVSTHIESLTLFIDSEKVKMKTHFVVEDAIKNV